MTDKLNRAYLLGPVLGQGGGGKVYRAKQRSTGQDVAVKVLSMTDAEEQGPAGDRSRKLERFRREMRICAHLKHPGIVSLIDYGECEEGRCFLVFEHVPGETLATHLAAEGSLPVAQTVQLAKQVLAVLAYAHSMGVVHRDLKPSNLMLGNRSIEQIRVLDFGTATLLEPSAAHAHLTTHGEVLGTPAYAAPEQLRGDAPSARSDLYSFGLVVLECLTGKNPMAGASVAEIFANQLASTPVQLPKALHDHVLGHLLRWVLQKEPASRASNASELLSAIEHVDVAGIVDASGYLLEGRSCAPAPEAIAVTETANASMAPSESRPIVLVCVHTGSAALLDDAERLRLCDLVRAQMELSDGTPLAQLGDIQLYAFGLDRTRDYAATSAGRAALRLPKLRVGSSDFVLSAGIHVAEHTTSERSRARLAVSHAAGIAHGLALSSAAATGDDLHLSSNRQASVRVLVSGAYRALAGRAFRFVEVDEPTPRGQSTAGEGHWLLEVSEPGQQELSRFVGRDALLEQMREQARTGHVAIWLRGPAGVGKSRLAREFQSVSPSSQQAVLLRHSTELQHLALGAVMQLLESELLPAEPDLGVVAEVLREYGVYGEEQVSVLSAWLGIPLSAPYAALPHSPQLQRGMLHTLLANLVTALCVRRDAFLLVEDLHWADFSSLEWLEMVAARLAQEGKFALLTSRREASLQWEKVKLHTLELSELTGDAAARLVRSVRGAEHLAQDQVDAIVARTGGNPFFIEELTLTALRRDTSVSHLPGVLKDVVGRELDRLGPAKRTLRVASVIGNEVELALLADATGPHDQNLLPELELLVSHQVLQRVNTGADTRFQFRHALLRDTAYASIPAAELQGVHRRLGDVLAAGRGLTNPGRAARHYQQGGAFAAAIPQFLAASERSLSIGAHREAKVETDEGYRCLAELAFSTSKLDLEIDLIYHTLACFFQQMGAALPPEATALVERGAELIESASLDNQRAFTLRWTLWQALHLKADQRAALPMARQLLQQANAIGSPLHRIGAEDALGRTAFFMGQLQLAGKHFDEAIRLHEPSMTTALGKAFVVDPVINCFAFGALNQLIRGELRAAPLTYATGIERSRAAGAYGALAGVLATATSLDVLRQLEEETLNFETAQQYLSEGLKLSTEYGQPMWGMMAQAWLGIIAAMQGDANVLQMLAKQFLAIVNLHGASMFIIPVVRLLVDRDPLQALSLLDAFDAAAEQRAEGFYAAESVRVRARALRSVGQLDEARHHARKALSLARTEGARLFEVRAAIELYEASEGGTEHHDAKAELVRSLAYFKAQQLAPELPSIGKWLARTES